MKFLKNNSIRLGAIYGMLLVVLDFTNLHTWFSDRSWTLIHDLALLFTFILLCIIGINQLRKQKKLYSFKSGYVKSIGIGIAGVAIYFLIGLLINAFYLESVRSIVDLYAGMLPNLILQGGINIFQLLFFSLLPPAYFYIMKGNRR